MPIFEYVCKKCGREFEELVLSKDQIPPCPDCGAKNVEKMLSASSTLTGKEATQLPGPTDHGCCGESPGAKGCVPGTCCGRAGRH